MPLTIKNWKLTLLALIFIILFSALGFWQLSRATQKEALLASFALRTQHAPLTANALDPTKDQRFYRIQLDGIFDNAHSVLLDNKIQDGKIGYEIYTPFHATQLAQPILVDRGFIQIGINRQTLPKIRDVTGKVSIIGMLNTPPTYVALGKLYESPNLVWPLRVEYINLAELKPFVGDLSTPYVINLSPTDAAAYDMKWQIVTMAPEKHKGYAVQWFAFALTLLILSVALNRR